MTTFLLQTFFLEKKRTFFLVIFLCFLYTLKAQPQVDSIYNKDIHTIQIYKKGWELSYPIIELDTQEQLEISFDDLSNTSKNYWYKLTHCNADWLPEDVSYTEFSNGFEQNSISTIQFSVNTTIPYTHYSFLLPNNDIQFKISGNYILTIFEDINDPKIAFTSRLYITESKALIDLNIIQPQLPKYAKRNQQFQLKINPLLDEKININEEIRIHLFKNFDPLTKLEIKPTYIDNDGIIISDDPDINIIRGGNEFRNFDIKSIKYQSPHIQSIAYTENSYLIQLYPDDFRNRKPYLSDNDINGKYFIENSRGKSKQIDAEYLKVNFTLNSDFLADGNIFLHGLLTNWSCSSACKMEYNFNLHAYELSLLLKQGYYNYNYKLITSDSTTNSAENIEGDYFETENEYIVLVYYKSSFGRYERLLSYKIANSIRKANSNK